MANADYATSPVIGARLSAASATAEHALGTVVFGNANTAWVYVQANGAVATGTCTVDGSFQLTDVAGNHTADIAFADNEYGWVRQTAVAAG
jgi:hypothetical protein